MIKLFDDDDTPAAPREREPPKPGTPEALMGGNHREAALGALRHAHKLNQWEIDFAISMTHARSLTFRQAEKLCLVICKANLPTPRVPKRRRRSRQ